MRRFDLWLCSLGMSMLFSCEQDVSDGGSEIADSDGGSEIIDLQAESVMSVHRRWKEFNWELGTVSGEINGLIAEIRQTARNQSLLIVFLLNEETSAPAVFFTPIDEGVVRIKCGNLEYDRVLSRSGTVIDYIFQGEVTSRVAPEWVSDDERKELIEQVKSEGFEPKVLVKMPY